MALSQREEIEYILLMEAELRYQARHKLSAMYPETGPFRRSAYAKHLEFFRAGETHRERLALGANRTGKSWGIGGYETALHLTGQYPDWWPGRRFAHPVRWWACGETGKKVKETVQEVLLGPPDTWGTGLIPGDTLLQIDRASGGVKDSVDTVYVRHASGGRSVCTFKSYEQGRKGFEGTYQDGIWEDEEAPVDVHGECRLRTLDTTGTGQYNGMLLLTFTPLQGLSELVLEFLPTGELPSGPQTGSRYVVNIEWDDVPHLDEASKAELRSTIPPYQRDARTRGLPVLGAGAVFPVEEDAFLVDDFALPKHYRRAYGLDVGWQRTAAPWGAYDPEAGCWYLYSEHYRGEAEPSIHAAAIKARGDWIHGAIDPAANGRGQADGEQLLKNYRALGLHLTPADNSRESGLYEMWDRLSTGRLKVFQSLGHWRKECRTFHRDEKGRIVNEQQYHLMAASRYLIMSGLPLAKPVPVPVVTAPPKRVLVSGKGTGWMR